MSAAAETTIAPQTDAPGEVMLDIEGLNVTYPVYEEESVHAVRDLDLSVRAGEIVGLVGESGSGKTTLARAVMGLLTQPGRIDSGSIRFDGQDMRTLSENQLRAVRGRDIAMVIPNPRSELDPLVPVGKQIAAVARAHLDIRRAEADAMALDMLKAVHIPDPTRRFRAFPHELSGGMAQRVVMAISLVCSPKFVISDDATSGLDVTVQAQVLDLLRTLVREHDTSHALRHPRHRHHRPLLRPRRGDLPRRDRGIRGDRPLLREPAASVQRHAARRLRPQSDAQEQVAQAARLDRSPGGPGLPVRAALRPPRRRVRRAPPRAGANAAPATSCAATSRWERVA